MRTHDDIYEASMELFIRRGYQDVTIDEICEASGISKATFFRYYGSKFGLVDEFNQRIAAKISAAVDFESMSASDALMKATDILYEEWLQSASQMRNLAEEFLRSGVQMSPDNIADPMTRNMLVPLVAAIRTGQQRREFVSGVDPELVAPMIVQAWTMGTARWFAHDDRKEFRDTVRALVQLIIRGLLQPVKT
ncbi:TetR/AcrR family transcriptional regulator [Phenylobacterium sp.]|uniref:TetR/AcrR family transcriptional regulator n=1 Tax=Phenylobacterium sp. TaxID=1871053 RepID=UPI002F41CEC8